MGRSMSKTERAFYRELGAWLAVKRRTLRLSQLALGREFGVGSDTLSRWERGKSPIPAYAQHRVKAMVREKGLQL